MIEHTVFLYLSVRVQSASVGFIFNMALYPRLYALLNTALSMTVFKTLQKTSQSLLLCTAECAVFIML